MESWGGGGVIQRVQAAHVGFCVDVSSERIMETAAF